MVQTGNCRLYLGVVGGMDGILFLGYRISIAYTWIVLVCHMLCSASSAAYDCFSTSWDASMDDMIVVGLY
jgi:hypothetical protein